MTPQESADLAAFLAAHAQVLVGVIRRGAIYCTILPGEQLRALPDKFSVGGRSYSVYCNHEVGRAGYGY